MPASPEARAQALGARDNPFPLSVKRVLHSASTGRVAVDATKVMIVNSGTTTLRHETGEVDLAAGQVVLLPPGRWYAGEPAGLVITTTAYIDTAFLEEQERWITQSSAPAPLVLSDSHRSDPTVLDVPSTVFPHVNASLQRLIDGERHHLPTLRRLSLAVDLLDILTRPVPEHSPEHPSVRHAMALLMNDLGRAWTMDVLADEAAISRSQLARLFTRHVGTSPAAFLRNERSRRMADLLRSSSDTVETIARRVGWTDPSHASRAFRQVHGLSPQQYRQIYRR